MPAPLPSETPTQTLERLTRGLEFELNSGCWLWSRGADSQGYGKIAIGHCREMKTHRLMFQLAVRPIRDGEHVLHRCDTPACCNPSHLFAGTPKDNCQDAARKGRNALQRKPERSAWRNPKHRYLSPKGEAHHNAKLTSEIVVAIRAEFRPGATGARPEGGFRWLARKYGVCWTTIRRVVRLQTWQPYGPFLEDAE